MIIRLLAVWTMITASGLGQVLVQFSPEPMLLTKALRPGIGTWSVTGCNQGSGPVVVQSEWFYIAASSHIRPITPAHVRLIFSSAKSDNWRSRIIRWVSYGGLIATAATGFNAIAANTKVVASIALGSATAMELSKRLQTDIPAADPFLSDLLDRPIALQPRECFVRTIYSSVLPSSQATPFQQIIQ